MLTYGKEEVDGGKKQKKLVYNDLKYSYKENRDILNTAVLRFLEKYRTHCIIAHLVMSGRSTFVKPVIRAVIQTENLNNKSTSFERLQKNLMS